MDYSSTIIILGSLLFSAFFSGMEMAFIASNRLKLELDSNKGGFLSKILSSFTKKSDEFIVTMLLGNNIALVFYGVYMGKFVIELLFPYYIDKLDLPIWILLVQTLISTLIILITAEFFPKVIFKVYSNELLKLFVVPAYLFYKVFSVLKITTFVAWISNIILKVLFKLPVPKDKKVFKMIDFGNYINEQIGNIPENKLDIEFQILKKALVFSDIKVRECMIPRTEIKAIDYKNTIEELKELFIETGYSRIPLFKGDIDHTIGYVHSFELFKNPKTIKEILLPIKMIPETMLVKDLLNKFTRKRTSIAIVLDEYGGTSGLITLEDIVEELFGDIEDEHDKDKITNKKIANDTFLFSGKTEVKQANQIYKLELPTAEEYDTIAGLILHFNQNIPNQNEEIIINKKYKFKIISVSDTRIEELELNVIN